MANDPNTKVAVGEILVPSWYADIISRRKQQIKQMVQAADPNYQEEQERKRKDTKPAVFQDKSDPRRPVFIFGGKGMWYNDMREKALRLKEKPDPKDDPSRGQKRNPKEDLYVATDRAKRRQRGTRVFHMRNNPLAKE